MTVERIDLSGELGASPGYAYVARATGTIVCTAGAVPLDAEGNVIGPDDLETQTAAVIDSLAVALQGGGAEPDDVIKTTIYVVGERSNLGRAWRVFCTGPVRRRAEHTGGRDAPRL